MNRDRFFQCVRLIFFLLLPVLSACAPTATPLPPSPTVTTTSTLQPSPTRTAEQSTRTTQPTHTARPPTLTPTPRSVALKIAYTACIALEVRETCEINVMNADGSDVIRLTNDNFMDCCPAWSPDGDRIAFVSERDGNSREIYVMNADGSSLTNLTNHSAIDNSPAWSPDGARIAFYSNRDGNPEIYVMNADGSNPVQLTNNGDNYGPAWSPDGDKIAFYHDVILREWWVINADGSNPINLTIGSGWDTQIAWSPDSTKIAFVSEGGIGNLREISVMNADGSGQTQLTNDKLWHCCPAWSPDGRELAYVHDIEGTPEIRVMNADGSNPISLAALAGGDTRVCAWPLAWSPDGTRIAFMSCDDRGAEIYVMNADGSSLTQLTTAGGSGPAWLPTLPEPATPRADCTSGWTRLEAGVMAKVSEENTTPNRVRSGPSTADEIIAQLPPGTVVRLIEGPFCAGGLVFWKVESDLIPGGVGWTAEGDRTEYYLVPYKP